MSALPEMIPVKSRILTAIGWVEEESILYIKFTRGSVYGYRNVSRALWDGFRMAKSKGSFFISQIKRNPAALPYFKVDALSSRQLGDDDPMPFGKHGPNSLEPKTIGQVDVTYLHWLWTNGKKHESSCPVADYIRRNKRAIEQQNFDLIWD